MGVPSGLFTEKPSLTTPAPHCLWLVPLSACAVWLLVEGQDFGSVFPVAGGLRTWLPTPPGLTGWDWPSGQRPDFTLTPDTLPSPGRKIWSLCSLAVLVRRGEEGSPVGEGGRWTLSPPSPLASRCFQELGSHRTTALPREADRPRVRFVLVRRWGHGPCLPHV